MFRIEGMGNAVIFAPITAQGRSGVNVVRLSGGVADIHYCLTQLGIQKELTPRMCTLMEVSTDQGVLDQALVTYFQTPASFTGEDVVELALHASPYILKELLRFLGSLPNVRLAEPGEFSKRAFLNGKIDLTQAEGIADLIASETARQHQQALHQYQGGASQVYNHWRQDLLDTRSLVESYLDFPDESLPDDLPPQIQRQLQGLLQDVTRYLEDHRAGERIRQGILVTIGGEPNVGKSSLLNYFSQKDLAIVSEYRGTTRDVIESYLDLAGYLVILADTAGLRLTDNPVEQEGIRRARQYLEEADLRLMMFAADELQSMTAESLAELLKPYPPDQSLAIINKSDLVDVDTLAQLRSHLVQHFLPENIWVISLKQHSGLVELKEGLAEKISQRFSDVGTAGLISCQRHRQALENCLNCLKEAMAQPLEENLELVAEDLRLASRALGQITGQITSEDILTNIFAKFCIGK